MKTLGTVVLCALALGATAETSKQSVRRAPLAATFHRCCACARPIYVVPELDACAIEGRWTSSGTFHHGDTIYWGAQQSGGSEFAFSAGVVTLVDPGIYTIALETPVASDCGMYNRVELRINGATVHTALGYGGTRILRNLYTYVKTDGENEVVSAIFLAGPEGQAGDGGAFATGAVLKISKD